MTDFNVNLYFENQTNADLGFDIIETANLVILKALELHNCVYNSSVSLFIVNDEEIRQINKENRNIDKVTDVLSFPNLDFESEGDWSFFNESNKMNYFDMDSNELILGDIVICESRVFSQAKEYGHSIKREFAFLVAHSILHLLGYDHMIDDERIRMEAKQNEILDLLNITRD